MEDTETIERMKREHPLVMFSVYTHIQTDITRSLGRDILGLLDAAFDAKGNDGTVLNRVYGQFWLWVLAAYEIVRTMCQARACFSDRLAGRLAALKTQVAELRIPFAKQQYPGVRGVPIEAEASISGWDAATKDITFEVGGKDISARALVTEFDEVIATVQPADVLHRHGWSPKYDVS